MKTRQIIMFCAAALFLAGCPYKSVHQLGAPSEKRFDKAFLGSWLSCDPKNKADCESLKVYSFNGAEYYAEMTGVSRSEQEVSVRTDRYRAFLTDTGVPGLLDVQELSISTAANTAHFYVKAEIKPDSTLVFSYVSDGFTKDEFASEKDLAGHFSRNYKTPGFFEVLPPFEREKSK